MAVSLPSRDTTIERQAEGWMNDPYEYFGYHNTRIHSLPREEAQAVQLAAMNLRLEERRRQIKMLEKLADGQGIRRINSLDDMAPLLMPHDVYKSYPVSLLAKQQVRQAQYLAFEAHALRSDRRRCLRLRFDRQLAHQASRPNAARCGDILGQHRHLLVLPQIEARLPAFDDGPARPALAEIRRGSQARRHRGQDPRDHSALSRWSRLDRRFREILRRDLCQGRPELLAHRLQLQDQLRSHVAGGAAARGGRQGRCEQGRRAAPRSLPVARNGRGCRKTCRRSSSSSSTG